ncbi:thiamine diphosphokinase [Cohnella zeiphila]|uniref:Thiamine diphosphokinase n=1 Tax=Cohnella zeiphila TaxID=2761120 RepID=A0A7X0SI16_9BACL|nr:thiamine diphosphokinase [Cohnella zeiphila]MBB6730332.1 thiamine diphosphokinase [Cohnella zeiphila]
MTNEQRKRASIYTGGTLGEWALPPEGADDFFIGADRGALFLVEHGIAPDLAVGDFDSIEPGQLGLVKAAARETLAFDAVDKDWTDTELALREAIGRGFHDIVLYGGLGTRFDHSLANVHLLELADASGCRATLADAHNEIRLLTGPAVCALEADPRYPYVSLLPLSPAASGITLRGFAYPLTDAALRIGMSLGVSNQLSARAGEIELREGKLLVIRSRD